MADMVRSYQMQLFDEFFYIPMEESEYKRLIRVTSLMLDATAKSLDACVEAHSLYSHSEDAK